MANLPYVEESGVRRYTEMHAVTYKANRANNIDGVTAALAELELSWFTIPYGVVMMPARERDGWLLIDFVSTEPFDLGHGVRSFATGAGEPLCQRTLDMVD